MPDGILKILVEGTKRINIKNFTKEDEFFEVEGEVIEIEDKKSKEYALLDTEYRSIDMILDPVKPVMELNPDVKDFFEFDNSKELKDVKVLNYKHMGKIDFPIAQ